MLAINSALDQRVASAMHAISETIEVRKRNNRDNIAQSLLAGKLLLEVIKPLIPHGHWLDWLESNSDKMGYSYMGANPIRQAQFDMQLWKYWKDKIGDLIAIGVINPIYFSDDHYGHANEVSRLLSDEDVNVSLSAMQIFTKKDVPDIASDMAIAVLAKDSKLSIKGAEEIVVVAKAIENLPEEVKDVAVHLYQNYGLSNPDVIEELTDIAANHPEILDEIMQSGHIFIPGTGEDGNGSQMRIDRISKTDIALATGKADVEEHLAKLQQDLSYLDYKHEFDFLARYEGGMPQILFQLSRDLGNAVDSSYYVTVYKRK